MAFNTLSLRDMTISLDHTEMTFLAGYPPFNILPMIETPSINFNISLRCEVTRDATPYGTRKAFPFPFGTSLIVMADEAIGFMDGKVHALDELGVTGGTPKLHFPSQLSGV